MLSNGTKIIKNAQSYLDAPQPFSANYKPHNLALITPAEEQESLVESRAKELISRIERAKINTMTPLEALNLLNELVLIQKKSSKTLFRDGQLLF